MLAVYNTMQYIRPAIATTCVGQAVGVGAMLLAAGAPGKHTALRTHGSSCTRLPRRAREPSPN